MPKREWLRNRRIDLLLTQRALSEKIGISVQHYGSIENGTGGGHISLGVAGRIAAALEVELDEFFAWEEDFQCRVHPKG